MITAINPAAQFAAGPAETTAAHGIKARAAAPEDANNTKFREAFHQFFGETFYGQMLKAMRSTQQKPAYFHGGRAEEVFQSQLDQVLAEEMTAATDPGWIEAMAELTLGDRLARAGIENKQ